MTAVALISTFLLALVPAAHADHGVARGCFWGGGNRCGLCISDPLRSTPCAAQPKSEWCDPPSQYLDEVLDFYTTEYMSDMDFCEAYRQVAFSQPGDVTADELQDIQTGVPALSKAITAVVYGVAGHEGVGADCTSDVLKQGINGRDLQTCINEFIVTHAESALEVAACESLSGGVLTAFCTGGLFKAATGFVNSFANKYIEQPIVHAMDSVEDAIAGVANTCANWFSGLFSLKLSHHSMNTTLAQVVV